MKHTPNVTKFPVLKNEEPLPSRNLSQASNSPVTPIVNDIGMGFQNAYRIAYFLGDREELSSG